LIVLALETTRGIRVRRRTLRKRLRGYWNVFGRDGAFFRVT
jgi:hypothetical protein